MNDIQKQLLNLRFLLNLHFLFKNEIWDVVLKKMKEEILVCRVNLDHQSVIVDWN